MGECLILKAGSGTDTSNATATDDKILSGYTAYVNDMLVTGTMVNHGSVSESLYAGGSYTIPEGFHNGNGKVTVVSLAEQTNATAVTTDILSRKTAWVNGSLVTGSMTDRGAASHTLTANGSYTIPAGYHNGSGRVTQSLATQGATTITPGTTNKTACAAGRWTTGTVTVQGDANLKSSNILKGVTIFGVAGSLIGYPSGPTDIYNRGSNPYGLRAVYNCRMDSGQITNTRERYVNDDFGWAMYVESASNVDLRGKTKLWMGGYGNGTSLGRRDRTSFKLKRLDINQTIGVIEFWGSDGDNMSGTFSKYCNISTNIITRIGFMSSSLPDEVSFYPGGAVYRLWTT